MEVGGGMGKKSYADAQFPITQLPLAKWSRSEMIQKTTHTMVFGLLSCVPLFLHQFKYKRKENLI